ncbi:MULTISPECIES: hypothetical protein [Burkholderia]|uniref:hypothetical protein n=1 Tax=Burkholderia TaxID=32008 RepID=UPI000B7A90D4|nr:MULTISPECIES: hypothetical protein [Burkholderia]MBY4722644.1 hypothetical protein [Burkholderia contaminans]MCI3974476.1 hypothetical protein [Burkholderia sp. HI4860]MDN7789190.1 hypothetical protein [Burkholderia contaminans]OXI94089.1 hypothetical protein CFB48_35070 [Burkholderia sp. AU33647]
MSHPVFLESPPWPRMPEGRKGELNAYFAAGGPSLEANAFIPLFWRVLFGPDDVRFAYRIDDFDPEDQADELDEYLEGATPEERDARYPYLVTTKANALARAAARRDTLVDLLGERYRSIYDAFVDYVATAFGEFVLVRTSGLPDVCDITDAFATELAQVALLERQKDPDAGLAREIQELRRAPDADAVWRVTGSGDAHADAHPWPSRALVEAFPACAPRARQAAPIPRDPSDKPRYRSRNRLDNVLEWGAACIFAAAFIGTWITTKSIWLASGVTAVVTAILVWGIARVQRIK